MAHSPVLYLVAGAALFFFVVTRINLYLSRRRMIKANGCEPCPYRRNKEPILGWDQIQEHRLHMKSHRILEGNQARFRNLGTNTFHSHMMTSDTIATIEPENIKTVLSLKFKDYSLGQRKKTFSPLLGDGIFNNDGDRWSNSRHLLRPNFAREQVADLEAFERHFQSMLKHIPRDGSTVDLQDLFFKLTIDTATEFLFNHSTNSLRITGEPDDRNEDIAFSRAFTYAQADIIKSSRLGPFSRFRRNKKGQDAIQICHAYIDKWVDEAVAWREARDEEIKAGGEKEEQRYVFIHELAKQTSNKKMIRDELINVLLAGRDTTASLLSNMFFELAKQPATYAKLRQEIASLNGRTPSYEELRNLKYLKWCLNEALRLWPVVPSNSRCAIRDTVLPLGGGPSGKSPLFVPAGTIVGYSPYTMHRRTDIYGSDAHLYRPERWEQLRPSWEYLPFNGGPRICLGQQYALTEASYITTRLVQEFAACESRDDNGGVWQESLTLTVCSHGGTKVGLTPA